MSKLAEYYRDKIIFATGFTGAMGTISAFKLLRCTKLKRIYALVRCRPGQDPQERLETCWTSRIPLSAGSMKFDKRVVAVRGDITAGPLLGMDANIVEELRQSVQIALHFSADINLKKTAKQLAETNVVGTLAVAELLSSFPKLERFVGAMQIAVGDEADLRGRASLQHYTPIRTWTLSTKRSILCWSLRKNWSVCWKESHLWTSSPSARHTRCVSPRQTS